MRSASAPTSTASMTMCKDLAHPADYIHLGEVLLNHYSAEQTDKFLYKNWHQFLLQHLPS